MKGINGLVRKSLIGALYLFTSLVAKPQSLTIDSLGNNWLTYNEQLSADGTIAVYEMYKGKRSLTIQRTDNSGKREFTDGHDAAISCDGLLVCFTDYSHNLYLYNTKSLRAKSIPGVLSYRLNRHPIYKRIVYLKDNNEHELVLTDETQKKSKEFSNAEDFFFDEAGENLFIKTTKHLIKYNIVSNFTDTLFDGHIGGKVYSDEKGLNLAFFTSNGKLFWYNQSIRSLQVVIDSATCMDKFGAEFQLALEKPIFFDKQGSKLFFRINSKGQELQQGIGLNMWAYIDDELQTKQQDQLLIASQRTYLCVALSGQHKLIRLENILDDFTSQPSSIAENNNYFRFFSRGDGSEQYWRFSACSNIDLVNTSDGHRINVVRQLPQWGGNVKFSAGGKYLWWFDQLNRKYYVYDINRGETVDISSSISVDLFDHNDVPGSYPPYGIAGWLPNDSAILIYDQYDIWKVSLHNRLPPENLTAGYGREHRIVFRLLSFGNKHNTQCLDPSEPGVLSAFNLTDKENGFYLLYYDRNGAPEKCTMGPHIYYVDKTEPLAVYASTIGMHPIKAKSAIAYLVKRMDEKQIPEIYYTRDFKQFTRLSDLSGKRWYYTGISTELLHFVRKDGTIGVGVLYKPVQIDTTKKYPLILYYYERLSKGQHQFIYPELSGGAINIPFFVNNGYLVFVPDISYTPGAPCQSASQTIIAAAEYISTHPLVDSLSMGLQGHSFGGYETNCVITQSNMFKAAVSAAGIADLISFYGSGYFANVSYQYMLERGQTRMGTTPFEDPLGYVRNSPLYAAKDVNTPLLIISNREDAVVPFTQGLAFFQSFRKENKKCWMLQYDGAGHTISDDEQARDYTLKVKEYFDYFLKRNRRPVWLSGPTN